MRKIHPLSPFLVSKVWGGDKLAKLKGIRDPKALPLGETWEVSRLEEGPSKNQEGDNLKELYSEEQIPYLIKFIDTTDNLSVQVHPGDDYARRIENSTGKTECWIILDAQVGEGIYLGLKKGVDKDQLKRAIEGNQNVSELLNFYPVNPGDFYFVPAGSIHAIGKNITLAEVQQSSGITYRVWDWNRVGLDGKARELHIEKALDVINFDTNLNTSDVFKIKKGLLEASSQQLINHSCFSLSLISLAKNESWKYQREGTGRITSIIMLSGEVIAEKDILRPYCSYLIDQELKEISLKSNSDDKTLFLVVS